MGAILVTGASGNVGKEVVAACRALRLSVVAAGADRPFDFRVRSTWDGALEGCDQLFLLRPPPIADVAQTINPFIDHAQARGVGHVIFLSVMGVEHNQRVPHFAVERHLRTTGEAWTFLRPGFFAQNFEGAYLADLIEASRVYVPAGAGEVAFVDVRDVGRVAAGIFREPAAHRGKAYVLTGPRRFTFSAAAALLTRELKRPIRYEAASIAGYAWHLWRARRMSPMQVAIQTYLHVGLRKGDAAAVDPTLERLLGGRPHDLEQYFIDRATTWATVA